MQHGSVFRSKNHWKNRKIPIPRAIIKLINFGTDVSSIFAAFWKPSWTHIGHLSRPKTAQEAFKTVSGRLQDDPKSAPRSNTTWARDQNRGTPSVRGGTPSAQVVFWSILVDCCSMFGWFGDQFTLIFGRFVVDLLITFLSIFDRFLIEFACIHPSKLPRRQ